MLNWFLAASKGGLELFYASVEGLMLIYVVYWNLGLAWWETVQWNHVIIFKGYKWFPQMRYYTIYTAKLFQHKSFPIIFLKKNPQS